MEENEIVSIDENVNLETTDDGRKIFSVDLPELNAEEAQAYLDKLMVEISAKRVMPVVKKAYIVVTHSYTPNLAARKPEDAWHANELCEFVTNLKKKHFTQATIIIDYKNKKVEKSRIEGVTFDSYMEYLDKEYTDKMVQFRRIVDGVSATVASETATVSE